MPGLFNGSNQYVDLGGENDSLRNRTAIAISF